MGKWSGATQVASAATPTTTAPSARPRTSIAARRSLRPSRPKATSTARYSSARPYSSSAREAAWDQVDESSVHAQNAASATDTSTSDRDGVRRVANVVAATSASVASAAAAVASGKKPPDAKQSAASAAPGASSTAPLGSDDHDTRRSYS